ncbi:MAG: hypothetical protein M4579_005134 [Chaenotheca gracillima]|nr:MAG: hypothetical protein M4579_005134 [Chaenotheca gracillima]
MAKFDAANLPIIDFAKIVGKGTSEDSCSAAASHAEKKELFRALKDVGFVYLQHPGVSQSTVDTLFAHSKTFFDQPEAAKVKLLGSQDRPRGPSQGWSSPVRFSARPETSDLKEFFGIYRDDDAERPNQWPEGWGQLRADYTSFFETCHGVLGVLLHVLAEEIGLEVDFFDSFISEKNHFSAMIYYPEVPLASFKDRVRSATHTDYGCMTLLFNDGGEGLQVAGSDGDFHYVPRKPDCAVVNVGDLLSRLFNGDLRSTRHRVIEPPPKADAKGVVPARYSLAFFGHFNPDLRVEPLAACVSTDHPRQFEAVVAGEHVKQRVTQLHVAGHSLTQKS